MPRLTVRMTDDGRFRLGVVAAMMGMPMSTYIKILLDSKWVELSENGMLDTFFDRLTKDEANALLKCIPNRGK